MKATAKCKNRDCKHYDMEFELPIHFKQRPAAGYCDYCLVGQLHIALDLQDTEQEMIIAQFDIHKILEGK